MLYRGSIIPPLKKNPPQSDEGDIYARGTKPIEII